MKINFKAKPILDLAKASSVFAEKLAICNKPLEATICYEIGDFISKLMDVPMEGKEKFEKRYQRRMARIISTYGKKNIREI